MSSRPAANTATDAQSTRRRAWPAPRGLGCPSWITVGWSYEGRARARRRESGGSPGRLAGDPALPQPQGRQLDELRHQHAEDDRARVEEGHAGWEGAEGGADGGEG